jgi:hypothetical protein
MKARFRINSEETKELEVTSVEEAISEARKLMKNEEMVVTSVVIKVLREIITLERSENNG